MSIQEMIVYKEKIIGAPGYSNKETKGKTLKTSQNGIFILLLYTKTRKKMPTTMPQFVYVARRIQNELAN